jgi:capsular polysaccharide biosynthesis protein
VPEDGRIYLPFLRDLVERLAIDAEFRIAAPEELLRFEQAALLTPVALYSRRKSAALRELRELLLTAYGTGGSRRLFVTRKPREKRTIANVASVESIFAGCGFEIVHPRRLTVAEQVRLFSQASHIAGPVGAGMANMLFAPNSAEILLIDPGLCDFFFWDAANLIGQPFHWHFASAPGRFDRSLVERAFHVDGQALLATLRSLGWTDGRSPVLGWRHRLSSSLWRRSQP